jgi:hypothetical protein
LRLVFPLKLGLHRWIGLAKRSGLTASAAFVAADKIESDRTNGGVKQRAVVDLVVSPPKLDERFLDNVFGISRGSCPLPGEKKQTGTDFRKATLPILMAGDVVHDLFTVFILKTPPTGGFVYAIEISIDRFGVERCRDFAPHDQSVFGNCSQNQIA